MARRNGGDWDTECVNERGTRQGFWRKHPIVMLINPVKTLAELNLSDTQPQKYENIRRVGLARIHMALKEYDLALQLMSQEYEQWVRDLSDIVLAAGSDSVGTIFDLPFAQKEAEKITRETAGAKLLVRGQATETGVKFMVTVSATCTLPHTASSMQKSPYNPVCFWPRMIRMMSFYADLKKEDKRAALRGHQGEVSSSLLLGGISDDRGGELMSVSGK